jgi:hypothetical protein
MYTISVLFDVQNILKRRIFKSSQILELLNSQQLSTFLRNFVHSSSGPRSQRIRNCGKYVPVKTSWHKKNWIFINTAVWNFWNAIICRENQNTHFMFNNFFPRNSCRFLRYVEKYGRAGRATDDIKRSPMLFSCWIFKATDSQSQYVKLSAFPRQLLR